MKQVNRYPSSSSRCESARLCFLSEDHIGILVVITFYAHTSEANCDGKRESGDFVNFLNMVERSGTESQRCPLRESQSSTTVSRKLS
jgi:hypothetical protein